MQDLPFFVGEVVDIDFLAQIREADSSKFVVERLIEGGMGVCIKVRHTISGNEYALKTIHKDFLEETDIWTMFIEEMKTWITLSACDGVAEAFCLTRINEIPYVCAQWMPGGDLHSRMNEITREGFFTNVVRIAKTLEWVHSTHNIIHRDLKPQNILIDNAGLAYVTDWGIARPVSKIRDYPELNSLNSELPSRPELTKAGQFKGTITYASPEQILGNPNLDHRSDIYSLGCVLFKLETGRAPFFGETSEEIAYKHLYEEPPQVSIDNFGTGQIISKCLKKEPSDRFGTYASLVAEILNVANMRGIKFEAYEPRQRYSMPKIGEREFQRKLESGEITQVRGKEGLVILEEDDILPFLKEAESLMTIGEWQKAADIYRRFFIAETIQANADTEFFQTIAVNYANCLISIGKPELAISALSALENAEEKPATYFVNISLAYLHIHDYQKAERTGRLGLALYEDDLDIMGNLSFSLCSQNKLDDALEVAEKRLNLSRDVHSLEEKAVILRSLAQDISEINLPKAVELYKEALELLVEAKQQNPRYTTVRLNLGKTLFDLRRYTNAANELIELGNNLKPHRSVVELSVVKIAECLDRRGQHKECLEFCNKWIEAFPENIELKRVRSQTFVDGYVIGNIQDGLPIVERSSLEFFEEITKNEKVREVSDLCYLARLYEWMKKTNEALELLHEAKNLSPTFWEPEYNIGVIYWRVNDFDTALPYLIKASELSPWRRQPWLILAKVFEGLGRESDAENANNHLEYLDKFLDELYDF